MVPVTLHQKNSVIKIGEGKDITIDFTKYQVDLMVAKQKQETRRTIVELLDQLREISRSHPDFNYSFGAFSRSLGINEAFSRGQMPILMDLNNAMKQEIIKLWE